VRINSPHSAGAYGNLASVLIALGDLARGFELQNKGRQAAERFGFASFLRHYQVEQALQDYWLGRWDAALAGADKFVAEADAGSPHYMEHACLQVRGLIRLGRGDLPGAVGDATAMVDFATQTRDVEALLPALAFHARALLANRRIQDAGARASHVLAILGERGALVTTPDWSGQLAVVLHALGRGTELLELAASVAAPTAWLRAATATAAGDFQQAADRYVQIGSLPDEAFARLRAAEQLLSAGRRADAKVQLQHALAFYRHVGAAGYLHEVDALLAASAYPRRQPERSPCTRTPAATPRRAARRLHAELQAGCRGVPASLRQGTQGGGRQRPSVRCPLRYRRPRKKVRTSPTRRSGASMAAKWPPRSNSVQWTMLWPRSP
jgi:tetratricopeptide (TPR) repeat protein